MKCGKWQRILFNKDEGCVLFSLIEVEGVRKILNAWIREPASVSSACVHY